MSKVGHVFFNSYLPRRPVRHSTNESFSKIHLIAFPTRHTLCQTVQTIEDSVHILVPFRILAVHLNLWLMIHINNVWQGRIVTIRVYNNTFLQKMSLWVN